MDILWITDPHLDHLSDQDLEQWLARISSFEGDAVLLTGDIAESNSICGFLRRVALCHPTIWFVLGNHDMYGSTIAETRARVNELCKAQSNLHYLPAQAPIQVSKIASLIGIDGWSDGRAGDFLASEVMLNDYRRIGELKNLERVERFQRLQQLGNEEASGLAASLAQIDTSVTQRLYVATHVPPFRQACWYQGSNELNEWTPHFTCVAVGEVLQIFAKKYSHIDIQVVCGHTHHSGVIMIEPNLSVHTGSAEYGLWQPHQFIAWD